MQCEDNSKLRTPLNEVCMTTDIGCVPIVNGQPQCSPMPDELPIAYDKTTSTLWLFSCESRTWVAMSKFSMDQLQELNLDNINNICNLLNIGVYYNPGTGNIQGTVTLSEFTTKLLECLKLDTNVLAITQGENNTISVSVEGLDGLPPFYIKGDNISFTGTGTQTDPLVVHGADPICKWLVASQAQVDAAATKHLGACLDGQPSRVPYPPKPCEYSSLSKAQVDAAGEKKLIACVDGESVKVPWIETPCEYERVTEESVAAASVKDIIACVDGKNVKIPIPQGFFADSPCNYPRATQDQVTSASEKDVIVCLDGKDYKIPIPSAFFDPEFLCIPEVLEMPTDPPPQGTGPIRAGCNGEIYLWVCEQNKWIKYETFAKHDYFTLTEEDKNNLIDTYVAQGSNICNEVKFHAWYNRGLKDECVEDVQLTLGQLSSLVQDCGGCCPVLCVSSSNNSEIEGVIQEKVHGAYCVWLNGTSERTIYSSRTNSIISGSGTVSGFSQSSSLVMTINVKNPFNVAAYMEVEVDCIFYRVAGPLTSAYAYYVLDRDINYNPFTNSHSRILSPNVGMLDLSSNYLGIVAYDEPPYTSDLTGKRGTGIAKYRMLLSPRQELTLYGHTYIVFWGGGPEHIDCKMSAFVKIFNNAGLCSSIDIDVPNVPDMPYPWENPDPDPDPNPNPNPNPNP